LAENLIAPEQNQSAQVSTTANPDGTTTYTLDLRHLRGTSRDVVLSMNLIGFGTGADAASQVTISNVRLFDTPVAVDETFTIAEDTQQTGTLATADTPADATFSLVSGPTHGSLTFNPDGSYSYTPDADYNGPDSFSYQLSNAGIASNIATVSITVTAVNDAPAATDTSATTAEDTAITGTLADAVSDIDTDLSALTFSIVSGPAHGSLILNPDGSYRYQADPDYNGADSFSYKVNDGQLDSNIATVSINVSAVDDAAVATSLNLTTAEDTVLLGRLTDAVSDIDTPKSNLNFSLVSGPAHGSLTLNANGFYTYTPDANYSGPDSFTYKVNDGELDSNVARVEIEVTAVNDPAVATDVSTETAEDTVLTGTLVGAVSDIDTDVSTLTFSLTVS
jgi:VCBS repeat-containing protein